MADCDGDEETDESARLRNTSMEIDAEHLEVLEVTTAMPVFLCAFVAWTTGVDVSFAESWRNQVQN